MYGENKKGFKINNFGGLVTDIPPSMLNSEATIARDLAIDLGNSGIKPRGGLAIVKPNVDQTDDTQVGVYYTKNIMANPTGDGLIVFVQKQPSGEIVDIYFWDNDYPDNAGTTSNFMFGWSDDA